MPLYTVHTRYWVAQCSNDVAGAPINKAEPYLWWALGLHPLTFRERTAQMGWQLYRSYYEPEGRRHWNDPPYIAMDTLLARDEGEPDGLKLCPEPGLKDQLRVR